MRECDCWGGDGGVFNGVIACHGILGACTEQSKILYIHLIRSYSIMCFFLSHGGKVLGERKLRFVLV